MKTSHQRLLTLFVIAAGASLVLEPRTAFASSNTVIECPTNGAGCLDHCPASQEDADNACWDYNLPYGCCAIGDKGSCSPSVCAAGYQVSCTFEPDIDHSCGHYD